MAEERKLSTALNVEPNSDVTVKYAQSKSSSRRSRQEAKAEAARAQMRFAAEQAELRHEDAALREREEITMAQSRRRRSELETRFGLLEGQRAVAAAEAEALDIEEFNESVASFSKPLNIHERTNNYVEDQQTQRLNIDAAKFPIGAGAAPTSFLNPHATPYIRHENTDGSNPNIAQELTRFLLKKDLLLSRFSHFNDEPSAYAVWKASFVNILHELGVNEREELDLLAKWLGPQSSKHAVSLRIANANDPAMGLTRTWERLDERYGAPELVEAALRKKLADFPKLPPRDYMRLYELSDILSEIESVKEDPRYSTLLSYFDSSIGINPVVAKLPFNIQNKWMDRAIKYKRQHIVTYPPFTCFVEFVRDMSKYMNDPSFVLEVPRQQREDVKTSPQGFPSNGHVSAKKTDVGPGVDSKADATTLCPIHETRHSLNDCNAFRLKALDERRQILRDNNLCYRCCESDTHIARNCIAKRTCKECGSSRHATALHLKRYEESFQQAKRPPQTTDSGERKEASPQTADSGEGNKTVDETVEAKCTSVCGDVFSGRSCAKMVLVNVSPIGHPEESVKVYAILDDQSNRTLAKTELLDLLGVSGERVQYTLSSCSGNTAMTGRRADGFSVQAIDGHQSFVLPTMIECNDIPDERSEIPTPEVANCYQHLVEVAKNIPSLDSNAQIQLLIGRDLPEAHHVHKQLVGPRDSPFAQKLSLGWVIIGDVCLGKVHRPNRVNVNKTHVLKDGRRTIFEPCQSSLLLKECEYDAVFKRAKDDDKIGLSVEDKMFLQIMETDFQKDAGGNWIAPLPFRPNRPKMPNNRPQAIKRAKILDNSLKKNPVKKQHFMDFMKKVLDSGAAEVAPPTNGECWYLPLFGVYHPKKPNQIRGVFDSSAVYEGVSLNSVLLSGPDLANNLLGVLLRFRKEAVGVTADIEQMFYSFFVREDHRDYLRFLWYRNNDPDCDLIEYRMCVHVFGNSPSPAVATYGLRETVNNCETCDSDVKEYVDRNFYVDDGLTSLPTASEAINLVRRTQEVLKTEGNIRLHKIISNSNEVMNAFPAEDLAKELKSLNIGEDLLPVQQSLGLKWDLNSDSFTFGFQQEDKPYTRRGLLSTVNSLFDPMGFIAPITIQGKFLLRDTAPEGVEWDQPLPLDRQAKWEEWKTSLEELENIHIPRMYGPSSLSVTKVSEILVYADASEKAIAAVAYLKTESADGESHVGFIMGKSKLAPSQGHTIPRLELCAAVLAVEIGETILENLDFTPSAVKYFTDSKVVLGYISNATRRFYTYVSNRVEQIRLLSSPDQWNYVPTHLNPADQGTRCTLTTESLADSMWLHGPPQRRSKDENDEQEEDQFRLVSPDDDKEIRPEIGVCKTTVTEGISSEFKKFSSWWRLVNAVTLLKGVIRNFRKKKDNEQRCDDFETSRVDSYLATERFIIKQDQQCFYKEELQCIRTGKSLPRNSALRQLDPFLDEDGVLRVGGRLNRADAQVKQKNPIIVCGKSHVANLVVNHFHERVRHQGRHFTEGAIRSNGYWIVGAKRLVSSLIFKCVTCRKLRGKLEHQKMADLPIARLTPGPPFTFVGVDVFGPWPVVARKTRGGLVNGKRWAVLFTCLTTRAIHIEVIEEMTTSSFINALRRFCSVRGAVKEFLSDRGTNFVGSTDHLEIDAMNVEDGPLKGFLYDAGTVWKFNPPHASHMGGVWERMIGVTRRILDSMLLDVKNKNLTHEVLVTFMAEVCAIVNARPIVPVSSDSECPLILTPAILLTQKTDKATEPFQHLDVKDMYRAHWKHVQVLAETFWNRWRREYLPTLQARQKWHDTRPNVKEGSVVLLKDKTVARNYWPMGVVLRAFPGEDNLVRTVEVRVIKEGKPTVYIRPVTEIVPLISND
jgi:hypothetical protein